MNHNICKQKQALVEKLGVLLEDKEQIAPVAARILSYIILTGKVGTTFEDLLTHLCASKSTISTHLNLLQDLKHIVYFTKPGDRKKYFVMTKDMILRGINTMIDSWATQKDLHLEIKRYKENVNTAVGDYESANFDLDFHDSYIKFIDEATKSILKLKAQITENHNNI